MGNFEMPRWPEDAEDVVASRPNPGGLLAGLPDSDTGSSLHLLMEPRDIAAVPGLPQYVHDGAARYHQQMAQFAGPAMDQRTVPAASKSSASNSDVEGNAAIERDIRNLQDEAVDRAVSATKGQGKSTTYTRADGRTYTLTGDRPTRNNNPLNITYGPFARSHGAIGRDGRFAIFGAPADGFDAAVANFDRMTWHGSMPQYPTSKMTWDFWSGTAPLNTLVRMWSPPRENDTKGMIREITRGHI